MSFTLRICFCTDYYATVLEFDSNATVLEFDSNAIVLELDTMLECPNAVSIDTTVLQ